MYPFSLGAVGAVTKGPPNNRHLGFRDVGVSLRHLLVHFLNDNTNVGTNVGPHVYLHSIEFVLLPQYTKIGLAMEQHQ